MKMNLQEENTFPYEWFRRLLLLRRQKTTRKCPISLESQQKSRRQHFFEKQAGKDISSQISLVFAFTMDSRRLDWKRTSRG